MGVTVKGADRDFVMVGRAVRLVPVKEKLLDLFAVGMVANDALALVAFER